MLGISDGIHFSTDFMSSVILTVAVIILICAVKYGVHRLLRKQE